MDQIRALTFDLDDTLWDNRPVLQAAEQTLFAWLSAHYPRFAELYTVESMFESRARLKQRHPEIGHDVTELRKAHLRLAADALGYDRNLVEPAMRVFLEARHRITLFDDVIPVLTKLRQAGYRLGSMTNGNADVHRLGMGGVFDFSLSAESVGRGKPHPAMFEAACRHAEVTPSELAHIGDDPATDLLGGRASGVTVIWMNRDRRPRSGEFELDAEIQSMADLIPLFGLER